MLNKEIDKQESLCNLTNYQSISTWVDVGQASLTLSWIVPLPIHWEQHFLHPTKSSHWILWCAQTLALESEQPDEGQMCFFVGLQLVLMTHSNCCILKQSIHSNTAMKSRNSQDLFHSDNFRVWPSFHDIDIRHDEGRFGAVTENDLVGN